MAGQTLDQLGLRQKLRETVIASNQQRSGWATPPVRRSIPLSVKTRIGYDQIVIEDWIANLLEEKPVAISIHGRTLKQGYKGDADWDAIAARSRSPGRRERSFWAMATCATWVMFIDEFVSAASTVFCSVAPLKATRGSSKPRSS